MVPGRLRLGRDDPLWLLESEWIKMGVGVGLDLRFKSWGAGGKGEERTGDKRAESRFEDTEGEVKTSMSYTSRQWGKESERDHGSPGAGLTGACDPTNMGATSGSFSRVNALNPYSSLQHCLEVLALPLILAQAWISSGWWGLTYRRPLYCALPPQVNFLPL